MIFETTSSLEKVITLSLLNHFWIGFNEGDLLVSSIKETWEIPRGRPPKIAWITPITWLEVMLFESCLDWE